MAGNGENAEENPSENETQKQGLCVHTIGHPFDKPLKKVHQQ